jgi:hypothetical protein
MLCVCVRACVRLFVAPVRPIDLSFICMHSTDFDVWLSTVNGVHPVKPLTLIPRVPTGAVHSHKTSREEKN